MSTIHPIFDHNAVQQAVSIIQNGGVIAFPTDTVYGIGVDVFQEKAVQKLFQIKNRDLDKGIPILCAAVEDLTQLTETLPDRITEVIKAFWPGPLTLILPGSPALPAVLSPDNSIGIRIPAHPEILDLLRRTGPLAVTSANLSGFPSATTAQQVLDQLAGKLDLILDGGSSPGGQASTVLDLREKPRILREGPISLEKINEFLGL
jgi:L-threonylcarbamoyladenylate synthase